MAFLFGEKGHGRPTDRPTDRHANGPGSFCPSPPAALSRLFGETMQCRASINKLA